MNADQISKSRIPILIFAIASLLFIGLIYAFSMFAGPMVRELELGASDVGLTFNIMMIAFCLGCIAQSYLVRVVGLAACMRISAIMLLACFGGTGLFGHHNLLALYLLYGVCGGAGAGIGYNCVVSTTNLWFPDKVGLASGVLMMGFGASPLLMGNAAVQVIELAGLKVAFLFLGVAACLVVATASFLIKTPPRDIVQIMCPNQVTSAGYNPADEDRLFKTPIFWVYWPCSIVFGAIGLATIGNCAADAQSLGITAAPATMLVGLVSLCNTFGRLIIGTVYDKTSVKAAVAVNVCAALVASVLVLIAFATGNPTVYIVGALCCGINHGSVPVISAAFSKQRFGAKNYAFNLSITNFGLAIASFINILINMAVSTSAEPRMYAFAILAAAALAALGGAFAFSKLWDIDRSKLEERRRLADKLALAQEPTDQAI